MRGWVVALVLLFLVEVAGATLLTNGGFENWSGGVLDNWTISGSGLSTEQEGDTVLAGTSSCKLVWTTKTIRWILQKHPVTAGTEYTYSLWAYDNDPFGRVRGTLRWHRGDGSLISSVNTSYSVDSTDWQRLSISALAPSLAETVHVEIKVYDVDWPPGTSATVFVDSARFCPIPTISDSGNVVINEIMYNPSATQGTDANFEWIELWNLDTDTMNMGGWTVSNTAKSYTIPGSTRVAPGYFLVVARNPDFIRQETEYSDNLGSDAILIGPSGLSLANTGDEVVIKNKDGKLIDSLRYEKGGTWPTSPNGNGPSLELYNPGLDNRLAQSWLGAVETYGTPGDTNSTFRWIADTSSYWDMAATWSPEGVPTPDYGVEIASGWTVTIRDAGGDAYCRNLIIEGTLTHTGGVDDTLFVYGDWNNDGTFNRGTGTVAFKGGGRREIDKNTGAAGRERFHNLVIELSSITDTIMAESRTETPVYYDSIWAANFTMKNGTFIQEQEQVKVDNNFTLSGGRYVMSGNKGEIDVAGDVDISSEFIFEQPDAVILCAGNLSISGDSTFISDKGQVLMNGSIDHNTVSISGTGNFINFFKIQATEAGGANLTDSVAATSDITVKRMSIIRGVYSPGRHKTTVTDTALLVGTRGTLRMKPGDTLDLKRGLWLNRGATYQANTEISGGLILCDGPFTDLTVAGFQPTGGEVRFGGGQLTTVIGSPQFHSLTIDGTILDVDSTTDTSYITVTHDTTFLNWGAIQKIQHRKVINNADTVFYDGFERRALVFTPTAGSMDSVRVHTRFGSMIPANAFGSGCAAGISSPTRYYYISPKGSGTATVKMYYYEGERGSMPADQMLQVRWDTTISHWDILPGDSTTRVVGVGGNPHSVEVTGVSQFSPFTLGGPGVLAVDLVFFNAEPGDGYITVNWSTASESGNKRWNLYRRDGDEDKMIFSVRGQGTVPHPTEYQYNDTLIVSDKTYLYKLAAVDENRDTTWYGPVVATAEFEILKTGFSGVYPNPFRKEMVISYQLSVTNRLPITSYRLPSVYMT